MSVTNLTTPPETTAPLPRAGSRRAWSGAGWWARVGLACALLALSGTARWWRGAQIERALKTRDRAPSPLKDLPLTLGAWRGEAAEFDATIARATGATDYLLRRYVNQSTGVGVDVIVLYGPATEVFIHKPETCYPSAGFVPKDNPRDCPITAGALQAPFRSLLYGRGEGGQADLQEVYYSWRFNDRWSPETGTMKQLERTAGMYKVHLARRVTEHERRDVGNPCEALLQVLLPALEQHLTRGAAAPSS